MSPTLLNTFIPEILCQPFDLILEDIDLQFVHDVTTDGTFEFIAPPLTRKPVLPTHLGKDHCSEFVRWGLLGLSWVCVRAPAPSCPDRHGDRVIDFANPERMVIQLSGQIDHGTDAVFGGFANMLKGGYQSI